MGLKRFLIIIAGIMLILFSYTTYAQSCSDISLEELDTFEIDESSDDFVTMMVSNESDETFFVDSVIVNDGSASFFSADYDDSDLSEIEPGDSAEISIDISSNSVSEDRTGNVDVTVRGHFDGGPNCSGSQIQASFDVKVSETGGSSGLSCEDIDIRSNDIEVNEDSSTNRTFTIRNGANKQFFVQEIRLRASSPYFGLASTTQAPREITAFSNGNLDFRVFSEEVSGRKTGTAYVSLRGYFYNDRNCSFSDIGENSFTVTVNESGTTGSCSSIDLRTRNIFINKNRTEYENFSIKNNSTRAFTVDEVIIDESSSYMEQSVQDFDASIGAGSTGNLRIRTRALDVIGTKTASSMLKVRGHFSDNNSCGFSDLSESFLTEIRDTDSGGDSSSGDTSAECDELQIETHTAEVNANSTINDTFYLRNNSTSRNFYIDSTSFSDSDEKFAASGLDFEGQANRNGERAALNFKLQAYDTSSEYSGTANVQVRGHYSNGETCSYSSIGTKSFSVRVNAVQAPPVQSPAPVQHAKMIEIVNYPDRIQFSERTFIAVTVKNNSAFSKSITLGFSGFPEGIMLETNTFTVPGSSTKTFYLDIDARGLSGTFSGKLFAQSEKATDEKSITLAAESATGEAQIDVQVQISQNNGSYNVVAKVKNNSNEAVSGTVSLDVPADWKVSGITELSLGAGEEKTTILNVVPSAQLSKEMVSALVFRASDGRQVRKIIAFSPFSGILGTALLLLSEAAAGIGVLVLVIIVLLLVWQKASK